MNVLSYPPILDAISLVNLRNEVQYFYPLEYNKWIGKYDEPENTIERYILDSFDFLLSSQYPTAVGFEWWIENLDGQYLQLLQEILRACMQTLQHIYQSNALLFRPKHYLKYLCHWAIQARA